MKTFEEALTKIINNRGLLEKSTPYLLESSPATHITWLSDIIVNTYAEGHGLGYDPLTCLMGTAETMFEIGIRVGMEMENNEIKELVLE